MAFDFIPDLSDGVISISLLNKNDFELLYEVASDKLLWAGHPSKNRYKRNIFKQWFDDALSSNHALKISETKTGKIVGSSRYYEYDSEKKEVAIGYTFIGRAYWGGETNKRVKKMMIDHAFETVNKIWLHADPTNIRSQKAIKKLGASFTHIERKILSNGVEEYYCYEISKQRHYSSNSKRL